MKITFKQLGDFFKTFDEALEKDPNIRMGQLFCNYYNITDPVLFHTQDREVAVMTIMDDYLDLSLLEGNNDEHSGEVEPLE